MFCYIVRGASMHGHQGAEAQGPTLEKLQGNNIFRIIIYMGVCSSDNSILQTNLHTHFQRRAGCSSLYSEWFSLCSPHTVCVVGMFLYLFLTYMVIYTVSGMHNQCFR